MSRLPLSPPLRFSSVRFAFEVRNTLHGSRIPVLPVPTRRIWLLGMVVPRRDEEEGGEGGKVVGKPAFFPSFYFIFFSTIELNVEGMEGGVLHKKYYYLFIPYHQTYQSI